MNILVLSYLFPNPAHPGYGIFVHRRLKAVHEFCTVRVIAPLQRYPFRDIVRPDLAIADDFGAKATMEGVEVWYPKFSVVPRYLKLFDAFSYFVAVKPVVRQMRQDGFAFDVIDAHWTYPDILAAYLLSHQYRKPFIVTVRGKEALYLGENGGRKQMLDWCLRRADAVVALSSELAGLVVDLGVEQARVRIVLNGVDTGSFHPIDKAEAREKLGLAQHRKMLLSVGRLTEGKGHQHIIRALPALACERDVELHVIGGVNAESDYSGKLKEQVATLGLNNVVFHSSIAHDHLPYWYNAADLFCLASHSEGCPNVVLEAMACGTPVVVTDVGSVKGMVAEECNGVVVENHDEFGEALRQALLKQWDRQGIAERIKARSWQGCAKQLMEIYHEVAATSRFMQRGK